MTGSIATRPRVPGRVARIIDVARAVAAIRRVEFCIVELTIFSIPLLVVAGAASDFGRTAVLEGALMFFVLYAFGDMINCVADRELDRAYKVRLSRAVYRLGVRRVMVLIWVEALAGLALATHLALTTGRWLILVLVLIGLALGWQYSTGPLRLKGRGLGHLVCLWLLLYFLPMLCASLLLEDALSLTVIAVAAAFATVEMGIILVNTSEDLPEDRAAGIRTTTVALGLERTLWLATAMVFAGGVAFSAIWIALFAERGVAGPGYVGVLLLVGTCIAADWRLARLLAAIRREDEETAVKLVKAAGPLVPIGATLVGWTGVICGLIVLGATGA
jgi:4-hydroxybenzoate polyprenyltransferase